MTTVLGIKTTSMLESIVLIADRQSSATEESKKYSVRKLYSGSFWVMGDVGSDDKDVLRFYGELRGDKRYGSDQKKAEETILRALEKKRFIEVDALNALISKKGGGDASEDTHRFVLAVNKPSTSLWIVDEYGNLIEPSEENELDYVCLGSGKEDVEKHISYLKSEEKIDRENNISTSDGIEIATSCLEVAQNNNLWTGMGYDLIILTKKDIKEISKDVIKDMKEAQKNRIGTYKESYDRLEKEEIQIKRQV